MKSKFWVIKIWVKKMVKTFLGQKNLDNKKYCVYTFWVNKNFVAKKFCGKIKFWENFEKKIL